MIIAAYSRLSIDQFFSALRLVSWGFVGLSLGCLFLSFTLLFSKAKESELTGLKTITTTHVESIVDFGKIGEGPLTLKKSYVDPLISSLSNQLVILSRNTRPDLQAKDQTFLIGLKETGEQKILMNDEPIYLDLIKQADLVWKIAKFSTEFTSCRMKPHLLDSHAVLMQIEMLNNDLVDKKLEFILNTPFQSASFNDKYEAFSTEETAFFAALKKGGWWGQDLLMKQYGGDEYQKVKNKHRIEFGSDTSSHVCLVEENDYLTWDEGRWKNVCFQNLLPSQPVAFIKSITAEYLEILAWDASGFHSIEMKLPLQKGTKLMRQEELLTSAHMRTSKQITCLIGKKRMLLKQGDWILKTAHGWRHLKSLKEIEAYLNYEMRGELFVFDQIEQENLKFFLKGNLFDEMRTQKQSIQINVAAEKKVNHSSKKTKKKKLFEKS